MSIQSTGSVLIVDDQGNWRRALSTLLREEGYDVSLEDSFEAAQSSLKTRVFNVVVLDVRLIDEDLFNVAGLELLSLIRGSSDTTRVIILTGYPDSIIGKIAADAVVLKVPKEATFDSVGFKQQVRDLLLESIGGERV